MDTSTRTISPSPRTRTATRPLTRGGRLWRRWRWPIVLAWVLAAITLTPVAGRLAGAIDDSTAASLPVGSQSTQVAALQDHADGGRTAQDAVVVFSRADARLTRADDAVIDRIRAAIARLSTPGAGRAATPGLVRPDEPVRSSDGRAALVDVAVTPASSSDTATIDAAVAALRRVVGPGARNGLDVAVTGDAALSADSDAGNADGTLLLTSAIVVALLLVMTYRSAVLWSVPLLAAGVATQAARAAAYGLAQAGLTVSTLASSILVVLVFGAATDYALLLVNRYRDELRRHDDHHDALAIAVRRTVPALVASAATVTAGLLVLLVAQLGNVRGLGPVCAAGVMCALAVQVTLLPAALAVGGRRLLWPRAPRPGASDRRRRTFWDVLGGLIGRRPGTVVAVTLAVLAPMVLGLLGLHGTLDPLDQFKGKPQSVEGERTVQDHFVAGQTDPLLVVLPPGGDVAAVRATVQATPGIASVATGAPIGTRRVVAAVLAADPDGTLAGHTIGALRTRLAGYRGVLVGGDPAVDADYRAASHRDTLVVLPLVLLAVGLVLTVLLRALVAPLVLLASVALSFAASWGASVWVFTHVFGFHGVQDGLTIFVFLFLVSLGVDYTIFLMARVKEESAHVATRDAVQRGLTSTGGVITAAALVLAGTFAALAQLPPVNLTEVGFAVAAGVLLDALLVRSLLVPAIVHLLGERVWWPRRAKRHRRCAAGS